MGTEDWKMELEWIPGEYRRKFFYEAESGFRLVITAKGGEIRMQQIGESKREESSMIMDWIEEAMMSIRKELGQEKEN